ncbi:MAG TPA: helix-turn-helix domain-containing protein [Gaiellaceae bacterium]|nr:helix-turn-helix domain-containing protein [Gaiellaceae bacterium]
MRPETIGARLRRLRLEQGLSQRELAAPGVSYAYISRIEADTRQPSVKALRKLAAKLGVSVAYLETGSDLDVAAELELRLSDLELEIRLGSARGAGKKLQALLGEALTTGNREAARRTRVALAGLAREAGRHEEMIHLLEAAVEGEPFSPVEWAELYGQLGWAYAASGRPQLAIALFERCLEVVREHDGAGALEARYAAVLSYALSDAGEIERAEDVLRESLAKVGETDDPYLRVRLYWSLARLAHSEGRAGAALASARKAIALLESTEDTINLARAHLLAAAISITKGNEAAATRDLDAAERLLGAAPSFADTAMLRVKRAQVAALRGDGDETVTLAREALDAIGGELPDERGVALAALGEGLALQGSAAESDGAFREAIDLLEAQHQWRAATQACRAWARALRDSGREHEALDVLDRAAALGLKAAPGDAVRS